MTGGVKVYITVNAIIYDNEQDELQRLLDAIKTAGVDAVICWDPAVITAARTRQLPIHISTQASISNCQAVQFYRNLGAERVVLARELDLRQIQHIKQQTGIEIEAFVHGAMCVSVSGRCFLSQFLHNKSGNRGDCYQPCRYGYRVTDPDTGSELELHNDYVMSPKDLCSLPVLDKLVIAGIDAFKIEGRSRPPEYIRTVTGIYRAAIDAISAGHFNQDQVDLWMNELKTVYNRGFSTGFLFGRPGPRDWSDREGSWASIRKVFIGKILNYYPNRRIAYLNVTSHPLRVNDKVQIFGATTGIVDLTIDELRDDNGRTVESVTKGRVTFPCKPLIRRNDQLYLLIDEQI